MHGKLPLWALLAALLDVKSAGLFVSALSSTVDAVPHRHIRLGHGTGEYTGWGLLLAFFPKFAFVPESRKKSPEAATLKNYNFRDLPPQKVAKYTTLLCLGVASS